MSREPHSTEDDAWIRIRGARQNNLCDLDLRLPKRRLSVITGVSGSGKSSLAFDTLYAEGQRRYVESFSTYARQFLERMDRPDVDAIDGLLPAVAIEQRNTIRAARSTLGTLTEVTDHLKLLFAARAVLHCPRCGAPVIPDLPGAIADDLTATHDGARLIIAFPFHAGSGDDARVATAFLRREGFTRLVSEDARVVDLDALDPDAGLGNLEVLIDRLVVRPDERQRLVEGLELAYRMGEDDAILRVERSDGGAPAARERLERRLVTRARRCCGQTFREPRPGMFSFNSPLGACSRCNGFGRIPDFDMGLVVPDPRKTLRRGAIRPWAKGKRSAERRALLRYCERADIDPDTPFGDLSADQRRGVLEGDAEHAWRGVRAWFRGLERKTYKMHVRVLLARYRAYLECPSCAGTRLQDESRWYRLEGLDVAEVSALPVSGAAAWLAQVSPPSRDATDPALAPVIDALRQRLTYLRRVGLDYLALDRQARTLSGGEVQRANLTSALGSGLVNTLFVLDEPSIGLHPRDSERLAGVLAELTRRDNTVVLVEHDPDVLAVADHIVELGPGPGEAGGRVVFSGTPDELGRHADAPTAIALRRRAGPRAAADRDCTHLPGITVRGARAHNLQDVTVHIPRARLTVVTGVSGSGKSTLLDEVLHRGALRARGRVTDPPGEHDGIDGLDDLSDVVMVDQASPAASPRANAATYVKAWDAIRTLFARQAEAGRRGFTAGTFSFNTGTGRCPACQGAGYERVEMQFLSDVFLTCPLCEGDRFRPEVLAVRYRDHSIADMLRLTVDAAVTLLGPRSAAGKRLAALAGAGLGYLRLGQPLATLSGGEAQRVKLALHTGLERTSGGLFLLDEPTTGLHLSDVDRLVDNLRRLVARGNTVVVIEHHLDVIAAADHVIDLGPEGGADGGRVVFEGPPTALAGHGGHTGRHLAAWLAGVDPLAAASQRPEARAPGEPADPTGASAGGDIVVEGARVHNLRDISVRIPRAGRTVVSGVSGSGKSSLAFDLVFAEGQRRFLDCLSPYARQYITQLGRPDADRIEGIPPTVAIEQRTTRGGAWSTVANVTEIEPYLRVLYARLGEAPGGAFGMRHTPGSLAEHLARLWPDRGLSVFAPTVKARKGYHRPVFARAAALGHERILVDGALCPVDPPPSLRRQRRHTIAFFVGVGHTSDPRAMAAVINAAAVLGEAEVQVGPAGEPPETWEVTPRHDDGLAPRLHLDPRYFTPRTDLGGCIGCAGRGVADDGTTCAACDGQRLGPIGRTVRLLGRTMPETLALTPPQLLAALDLDGLDDRSRAIAEGPFRAIGERARFLEDVGLGYLALDRGVRSLSAGEAQRIRLAAQLGAHLSGVLYVLDEPTIGLHPTDTERLLLALDALEARGNGVLMVEHDEATLRTADVLIDMGPGAGTEGGEVLAAGPIAAVLANPRSVTGRCLAAPRPPVRAEPRAVDEDGFITLERVRHHNLHDVTARVPRGRLTVVTGVSGSGKSSLIHDVLAAATAGEAPAGRWKAVRGLEGLVRVVNVDDAPIGKNPRSTPATYVGVWDHIRKLFARLPEARLRGYTASRFSFNVKGGRCDGCDGQGSIKVEMSFMPDAYVTCDVCSGRRFNRQTLFIAYRGHSIADVLEMPVRKALEVFEAVPRVQRALQLLDDVGLGYLQLGQPSPTLSGGEAQRIKLVSELLGRRRADTLMILDEPSTGLHMADLPRLLTVLHRLVDAGATVVVIEHNPDVMREADWILDLGPGSGPEGGRVVYEGPYAGLLAAPDSRTGAWLAAQQRPPTA